MKSCVLICSFVFLLIQIHAQAPQWLWAVSGGGVYCENYEGCGVASDSNGNCYITGSFWESASFGDQTLSGVGYDDIYVAKLDSNGNWLWAVQAGGGSYDFGIDIAVDSSSNVYITGYFEGTINLGSITLSTTTQVEAFVAKLDTNGNWLWARKINGTYNDHGHSIAVDALGNAFITGEFTEMASFGSTTLTSTGESDIYIAKLDTNGNWLWAVRAGSTYDDIGRSIAVDDNSNVYVTGEFEGTVSFGITTLTSSGDMDILVAKLSTEGNWLWAVKAGGNDYDIGYGIDLDAASNVYITGYFTSSATFGNTTLTSLGTYWDSDIFIAKLSSSGSWLWAHSAIGEGAYDKGNSIAVDNSGNSYITGFFEQTITFNNVILTSLVGFDIFVAKMDTDGNWIWAVRGGGSYSNYSYDIALDNSNNPFISGMFDNYAEFGPFTLTGNEDAFVAKLSSTATANNEETLPSAIVSSTMCDAYPNPAFKGVMVKTQVNMIKGDSGELSLYNLRGQKISSYKVKYGDQQINIKTQDMQAGIYMYCLKTSTSQITKKLLVVQ